MKNKSRKSRNKIEQLRDEERKGETKAQVTNPLPPPLLSRMDPAHKWEWEQGGP